MWKAGCAGHSPHDVVQSDSRQDRDAVPLHLPVCGELVTTGLELLAEQAASKGLELAYLLQAEVPTWVAGDLGRLRQILTNLGRVCKPCFGLYIS